jgi:hypothetical protein
VAETRSPALVRHEIAVERMALAEAVEGIRRRVAERTDVGARVGSRAVVLAPAAFLLTFVLSGGIGATMRYVARRSRNHR